MLQHAPLSDSVRCMEAVRRRSGSRLLLLLAVQGAKTATSNLDDLETHAGNVADGVAASSEARDQDFIVLVNEVQATIARHEGGDLLAILDQLDAAALADGRIRLLGLDANLLDDDALGMRGASERVALVLRAQVGLLVVLVRPSLRASAVHQLTRTPDTARLRTHGC